MFRLTDDDIARLAAGDVVVRDGNLGAAAAAAIAVEAEALDGVLTPAALGRARVLDLRERGDETCWVEPDAAGPAMRALLARFDELALALRTQLFLFARRFDVQLACYRRPGAAYARHRDALAGEPARSGARVATAIYYVNPDWRPAHGGQLRVFPPAGPREIEPLLDRLVLFASDLDHEVLPSHAPRRAITAWFTD